MQYAGFFDSCKIVLSYMLLSTLLSYFAISALVASTPGPSNILAARNGARHGLKAAAIAITGHMFAVFLLALITAVGLGAIILANEQVFIAVKFCGVAYLIWLGINMVKPAKTASSNRQSKSVEQESTTPKTTHFKLWLEHFAVAATNPKALLFFSSLFPQFVDLNKGLTGQFAVFLSMSLCSSFVFPLGYALLATKLAQSKRFNRKKKALSKITGMTFLGFGVALAVR